MKRRLGDERGFTLIELLMVCALLGFVIMGVGDLMVSGSRAASDTQGRVDAQQNAELADTRLQYEVRCASSATTFNSGAGVTMAFPSQCTHATTTTSWCVAAGVLSRYTTSNCTGRAQIFVRSVTSATPFSILTTSGYLPRLKVVLTVNESGRTSDAYALTDTIAFRNAPRTP